MRRLLILTAVVALVAVACSGGGAATTTSAAPGTTQAATTTAPATTTTTVAATTAAPGEPIKLGSVNSLTGQIVFPEASAAAKAVFDRVNAEGGIGGRPIEYLIEDDAGDPAGAAQAARRLVEDEGVVALVGSASLLECAVNGAYYAEQHVYAVQGTGVDPLCFASSNISPVNTGPYLGFTVGLYYASEVLGYDNVCILVFDIPDFRPAMNAAIQQWRDLTGKDLLFQNTSLLFTDDVTPFVLEAHDAGCQVVVSNGLDVHYIGFMQALQAQGIDDMTWVGLTSGYTADVAKTLGSVGAGDGILHVNSEFEPFTLESPVLADWKALMTSAGVPLTSFAEGGYVAATIMVDVLRGIDGEITRESVSEALLGLDAYQTPMMGSPYSFGDAPAHNPNRASKFVRLQGSDWVLATEDWVVLPSSN